MEDTWLRLPESDLARIVSHLVPEVMLHEEAAFGFAAYEASDGEPTFRLLEWAPVPTDGFESRSLYHLSLSDEARTGAIKRAHDLQCCLVEWHSHYGSRPAEFSSSDLWGFAEFVPHVRWRLGGRPYAAVVVADGSFDGFAWIDDGAPRRLSMRLEPGGTLLSPTRISPLDRVGIP